MQILSIKPFVMNPFHFYFYLSAIYFQGRIYSGKPKVICGVIGMFLALFGNVLVFSSIFSLHPSSKYGALLIMLLLFVVICAFYFHNRRGAKIICRYRRRLDRVHQSYFKYLFVWLLLTLIVVGGWYFIPSVIWRHLNR